MPDSPSNLELMLERWSRDAANTEPSLRPHLDELTDHLRSEVEARLAEGAELNEAFATATTALGVEMLNVFTPFLPLPATSTVRAVRSGAPTCRSPSMSRAAPMSSTRSSSAGPLAIRPVIHVCGSPLPVGR